MGTASSKAQAPRRKRQTGRLLRRPNGRFLRRRRQLHYGALRRRLKRAIHPISNGERSISVPSQPVPPASKCLGRRSEKRSNFRELQALHQIGAVMRSGEYGVPENSFSGLAQRPVFSPTRITLENNGKIRPQPDRENGFSKASGGAEGILQALP